MRLPGVRVGGEEESQRQLLRRGDHACVISDDASLRAAVVGRYAAEGLAHGERVVYAAGAHAAQRVLERLRREGVDVHAAIARRSLVVPEPDAIYGCGAEGVGFDPRRVVDTVAAAVARAQADGFAGVRLAGEAARAIDGALMPRVLEYEALLDRLLSTQRATALCVYDSAAWPRERADRVLRAHPVVLERDAPSHANPHYEPRHSARVLVVEDDADAAESLALLLEMLGHRCERAADAEAALARARSARFDVMLVDIGLPGIDGYEFARAVRNDPVIGDVVMVALTGFARPADRDAAFDAGFDRHLKKPAHPEELRALLARLDLARARRV